MRLARRGNPRFKDVGQSVDERSHQIKGDTMTLLEFVEQHYWPEHALSLKPSSLAQIRWSIAAFEKHLKRTANIEDFNRLTVIGFLAARQQQVSAATTNKDRRGLLCLWRLAAELRFCDWPHRLPKVKQPHKVPHTFSTDEMTRLIRAARHCDHASFWASLLLAAYDTAARISALMACKIEDVCFTNRTIRLRPEHSKTNTEQVLSIALDTAQAIAAHVLGRDGSELIWNFGHHQRRRFIHFRNLCEAANVKLPKGACFHSLRRTTATLLCRDLGLSQASQRLGHSSQAVTARYVDASRLDNVQTWLPPRP